VPTSPEPPTAPVVPAAAHRSWAGRAVRGFGRFWWEFLVGDTPELLVGAVVVVALAALLAHNGIPRAVTVVVLPVAVAALLCVSAAWVAVRRARKPPAPPPPPP